MASKGGGGGGGDAVLRQYIAVGTASLSFFIQGTSLGWPSPTIEKLKATTPITDAQISWMVSVLYFGNFLSPIPAGYLMDRMGRKRMLVTLSILPILSWVLVIFSTDPLILYVSRFLGGLWAGISATVIPMYQAEVSQPQVRGALSTFIQIMTYIGVCYEYILGPFVSYTTLGLLNVAIPVMFVSAFMWMPESPYWYTINNRKEEALEALTWLRSGLPRSTIEDELQLIEHSVREEMKNKKTFSDLISTRGNRRGLLIVEMLAIFQRMSGISGVMAFTSITIKPFTIFGILMTPDICVIIMGVVWIISTFISTALVDRSGRRPLLMTSSLGSGVAMTLIAIWFFLDRQTTLNVSHTQFLPFLGLLIYGLFFSIGMGPIASTIQGETFPANTKAKASAITSISLAVTSFIMNKIYLDVDNTIGMYFNFILFASACFMCLGFVVFFVIETKGKTLHDIQEELNTKKSDLV
uniref:Sugar transporter n=1 Tax=Nilaparvata lugens TaxID=108931 RepID=A0A0A8J8J2_NILLU|nr:sugar transporter [Nilaparvata lugens]